MENNQMFTHQEAELFVRQFLEDIIPNGKLEQLDNFYAKDAVGHYNGEQFGYDDIKARFNIMKESSKKSKFIVDNITLIDNLIAFSCKQYWIHKVNGHFHSALIFGIYKIKYRKICEVWMMWDLSTSSYTEVNKKFTEHMQHFEINHKNKQEFLTKINIICKSSINNPITLSKIERECLYYYLNGFSAKEAALILQRSPRTIETYLVRIKQKLACTNRFDLRQKLFPHNM